MSLYGDEAPKLTDKFIRCDGCKKLLAEEVTRPWTIRCGRCKHLNTRS